MTPRARNTATPDPASPLTETDADLLAQMLDAWAINNRINLLMLDHISDEAMSATLSKRGGRDISRQFAHVHMVRVSRLESTRGRDLAANMPRFESKEQPSRDRLKEALIASGDAVAQLLEDHATGRRDSRSIKRGVGVLFGYLIAHESHHRGSILLTLKQCGHPLDETMRWGIWDWDKL